jgi:hypothetical protein
MRLPHETTSIDERDFLLVECRYGSLLQTNDRRRFIDASSLKSLEDCGDGPERYADNVTSWNPYQPAPIS